MRLSQLDYNKASSRKRTGVDAIEYRQHFTVETNLISRKRHLTKANAMPPIRPIS